MKIYTLYECLNKSTQNGNEDVTIATDRKCDNCKKYYGYKMEILIILWIVCLTV